MNKKSIFSVRNLFISILTLFLFSCSTIPTSIELQPTINNQLKTPSLNSKIQWSINSIDYRVALHLIEISKGDDVAILVNESTSSRKLIEHQLTNYWTSNGLITSSNKDNENKNKIEIELQKMLSQTKQETFSHSTKSQIIIKVTLSNELKSFSKTFKSRKAKEGAFSADINELNKNITQQLTDLLEQIVQDDELNNKLTHL